MSQASDFLDHKWELNQSITYTFDSSSDIDLTAITSSSFQSSFELAMSAWSSVANLTFVENSTAIGTDFLIGWDSAPDGPGGTLGWALSIDVNSNGTMESADGDYSIVAMDPNDTDSFYSTAIHEIGHVLGLAHIDHTSSIMATFENGLSGLTDYDVSVIQELYGAVSAATVGTTAADALVGASSSDTISGGSGSDTISGLDGADIIYGNLEIDQIEGGSGNDTIYGGQNNGPASTGVGTASDGTSKQREGIETISGGGGDDVVYGNYGSDLLLGNDGNDKIFGGQDQDTLSGGAGNDTLYGNRGDDTLIGGDGSDTFVVQTNTISTVTINDFVAGTDIISASASRSSIADSADGALVTFANGSTVTLIGISASSVTDSYFL